MTRGDVIEHEDVIENEDEDVLENDDENENV